LSSEYASRLKKPIDTVKDLFVFYKVASIGLFDALLHSCDEARLIFKHPVDRILYQLFGILSIGRGYLLEPGFGIRREMYFHAPNVKIAKAYVNFVPIGFRLFNSDSTRPE
jgi:hypothetical protein